MRCCCCNRNLSNIESTNKHPITSEYLDMCNKCLKDMPYEAVPSATLKEDEDFYDDLADEYVVEEDDENE